MVQSMEQIDRDGMVAALEKAIHRVSRDVDGIYLSLDMDVVDPEVAPGVGTPVRGGLSYREAHLAMETVAEANVVTSLEIVEVNPMFDQGAATEFDKLVFDAWALEATDKKAANDVWVKAQRILHEDQFREDIHCMLMRAQAAVGNRVAVKTQYETLRELLQKELGVEPAMQTQTAFRELMES